MSSKLWIVWMVGAASVAISGCASAPKVLVNNQFFGQDKEEMILLQNSGQKNKANNKMLYNVIFRICDVNASGASSCKDTQVLDGVTPGSVY